MYKTAEQLKALIDDFISKEAFGKGPSGLYAPVRYIMQLGGKRLRPLLTLMSCQLFHDRPEGFLSQATSVEVFHNFTLMHDDIMDNAPLRRGQTTVHEKWDANTAILSGDVMLALANKYLLKGQEEKAHTLANMFNDCAIAVCEGQQYDMDFEQMEEVAEEDYLNMIRLKTAVLIGYSLELGAVLGGRPEEGNSLREFGINIGMGFQLRDDLLDLYADKEKFGKQIGGDIISRKKTFLYIAALDRADGKTRQELKQLYSEDVAASDTERVTSVRKIFDDLEIRSITEERIKDYFDQAFYSLKKVGAPLNRKSVVKDFVMALAERQQ